MTRFLDWLFPAASDARVSAPYAVYRHHLGDYMLRYIVQTPFGTLRLHNIRRSDKDRHLHDHPFDFTSLLLTGGYGEILPDRVVDWPRWSIVRHKAPDLHRLIVTEPIWTLVWTGPRLRSWGFMVDGEWVYWRKYLGIEEQDQTSRGEP